MRKYKAIIFDLGSVIVDISIPLIFKKWAELTPHDYNFFKKKLKLIQTLKLKKKLVEFEKGAISQEEFYTFVTDLFEISWNFEIFKKGWVHCLIGTSNDIISLLKQLKQNYKLYVLSNTNKIHAKFWEDNFPEVTKYFEQIFYSFKFHLSKPDPKIYKKVLKIIEINPNLLLFIDDKRKNVSGAKKLGINGIVAKSTPYLLKKLKKMGVIDNIKNN